MRPMETLWGTDAPLDEAIAEFTTAEDRPWDRRLLEWDVIGSLGHVEGLRSADLLDPGDAAGLTEGLRAALAAAREGTLDPAGYEDVHTAVEAWITERLPETGPRLHTGRSRNDQVTCDLRLWLKARLLAVHDAASAAAAALFDWAERHDDAVWPGYTHLRRAMPSSAGLWAAALGEGLVDTLESFPPVWSAVDRSPLGSAAGYGVPLPLDRDAAARALGFGAVEHNLAAVQNGRGKVEAGVAFWCVQLGHDLARLAADVILFATGEFGFLRLPPELATGSSIMPHKRNPDVFELTRARTAAAEGDLAAILRIRAGLTSGYHRDFQMIKEPTMRTVERIEATARTVARAVPLLEVDRDRAREAVSGDLLATDEVVRRVEAGVPFRTAYHEVAGELARGEVSPPLDPVDLAERRSTPGGLGDLDLDRPRDRLEELRSKVGADARRFHAAIDCLVGAASPGDDG